MSDEKPNLLRQWFEEVWNNAREEAIDELADDAIVAHGLYDAQGREICGKEKFRDFHRQFRSAFPDLRVEVNDELAVGDKALVRCTVFATHAGEGIGVPPCHKAISFTGMVLGRIENGRLKEVWDNWDFLGLYQQIGALPPSMVQ